MMQGQSTLEAGQLVKVLHAILEACVIMLVHNRFQAMFSPMEVQFMTISPQKVTELRLS